MATLYVRDVPAAFHRHFKVLCATRSLSIRTEVIYLIEEELAAVDDIKAALGTVLSPALSAGGNQRRDLAPDHAEAP